MTSLRIGIIGCGGIANSHTEGGFEKLVAEAETSSRKSRQVKVR